MPECWCGRCFRCAHAEMVSQRAGRRFTGRVLGPGDFVQAHTGDEIRVVVRCYSAGECLEASADLAAHAAREPRRSAAD